MSKNKNKKSQTNWGNRLFAILGLVIILTMVLALFLSAFSPT
ncbi:MAG: hypothetical protein Q7R39_18945 [Dehalococcoidia bacterium]|nr:hypothetical protein [Dehalococcoidia bacterium]